MKSFFNILIILNIFTANLFNIGYSRNLTEKDLEDVITEFNLPGGVGAIYSDISLNNPITIVSGIRKKGFPDKIEPTDRFQLASDGKALTATLFARLVDKELFSFESKLEEVFPRDEINPVYLNKGITFSHLLGHISGIIRSPYFYSEPFYIHLRNLETKNLNSTREIRSISRKEMLKLWPYWIPQTYWHYSNEGYQIVGNAIETKLNSTYEELLKKEVLDPLGMTSCNFGIQVKDKNSILQPWPHKYNEKQKTYQPIFDGNMKYVVPAGNINCSMQDLYKFLKANLLGVNGENTFLKKESFQKLHTKLSNLKDYGLGWFKDGSKSYHCGSDIYNRQYMEIDFEKSKILILSTNSHSEDTTKAFQKLKAIHSDLKEAKLCNSKN